MVPRLGVNLTMFAILAMAIEWILFVGGAHPHEMTVGALSIAAVAYFLSTVERHAKLHLRFTVHDLVSCWRIPWYLLSGTYEISRLLFKDILGINRAHSYYRVTEFKTDRKDPLMVGRRVLATVYTTVAPNFIVVGIDYQQHRMLFHQLERSSVPKMTKSLGAER